MLEEIALVAPAAVTPNSITTEKLANESVTTEKYKPKSVTAPVIADAAVGREQIALAAVDGDRLAPNSVTGSKAGNGIAKVLDAAGAEVALTIVRMSTSTYASISPDPNTLYLLYEG